MNFQNAPIHKMFDTNIYAMSNVFYRIISNLHFVTLSLFQDIFDPAINNLVPIKQ